MYLRTFLQSVFRKVSWCQWTTCTSQCARTCSISAQHATRTQGQCQCCSSCSSIPQIYKHKKRATVWRRLLKNKSNCTTHHKHCTHCSTHIMHIHKSFTIKTIIFFNNPLLSAA